MLSGAVTDTGTRVTPMLAIGSIGVQAGHFGIVAGRIAIPLGIQPPIFAARAPLASRPDISPDLPRTVLGVLARPSLGFGVSFRDDGFEVAAHAFKPLPSTIADQLFVSGNLISAASRAPTDRPSATPGCSVCELLFPLIGPTANEVDARQLALRFQNEALGIEPSTTALRSIGSPFYQAGVYYSGGTQRLALDVLHTGTSTSGRAGSFALAGAYEYSTTRAQFVVQPFAFNDTYGASSSIVVPFTRFMPYARLGYYGGNLRAVEFAGGVLALRGPLAARLSYQSLSVHSAAGRSARSGLIFSVSGSF